MPFIDSDNPKQQEHSAAASLASALLLTLSLLWCIYWFVHAWHYWEDDAWIHLEFARSLATGKGFAFNGHVVAGDTAPLWVFLIAAMHAIVPDWMIAGKVLTIFGAILGLAGTFAFARNLASTLLPPSFVTKVFPAAIVLLVVVNPYSCYWIFSGMEPFAAAGLACFAVLAATRNQPSTKSFLAACLLAGIAPLLRPEMIFLAALLALPLVGQWRRLGSSPARLALGLILAIAPLALWSLYSLHAFGHILPNTNAAKRAGPHDSVLVRLASTYSLGFPVIVCGLIAGIACLLLRASAVSRSIQNAIASALSRKPEPQTSSLPFAGLPFAGLPFAGWIFILWPSIAAAFYIANHTYIQTRYILVTAPGLTIVILVLALRHFQLSARFLYFAALAWALAFSLLTVRPFIRNKAINCEQVQKLGVFIHNQIPADEAVATYSIGEIAFVSQHNIVDTGGITRPDAIPYINSPHEILEWARTQGAVYYTSGHSPDPGAVAVYTVHSPFIGWTLHTSRYSTMDSFGLWKLANAGPPQPANSPTATHP